MAKAERVLGKGDLSTVSAHLAELCEDDLESLGLALGLHLPTIRRYGNATITKFRHSLIHDWICGKDDVSKCGEATWSSLESALRSKEVGQTKIANNIKSKFLKDGDQEHQVARKCDRGSEESAILESKSKRNDCAQVSSVQQDDYHNAYETAKANKCKLQGTFTQLVLTKLKATTTIVPYKYHKLKCVGKRIHSKFHELDSQGDTLWFKKDCKLLSELHYSKIPQFLSIDTCIEQCSMLPTLVMEDPPSILAKCLEHQQGPLPTDISYTILHDVAVGLCYLHDCSPSIIHCDLSANHVLLTTTMSAKISDFNVATILNISPYQMSHSTSTQVSGNLPPEVLTDIPHYKYATKIDSFSFGVLILHVLCGTWPFPTALLQSDSSLSGYKVVAEVERRTKYLQQLGTGNPLRILVSQCLSSHPHERPEAAEILQLLGVSTETVFQQFDSTKRENESSDDETMSLRSENKRLRSENKRLRSENKRLRRENKRLRRESERESKRLESENMELRIKLIELETKTREKQSRLMKYKEQIEEYERDINQYRQEATLALFEQKRLRGHAISLKDNQPSDCSQDYCDLFVMYTPDDDETVPNQEKLRARQALCEVFMLAYHGVKEATLQKAVHAVSEHIFKLQTSPQEDATLRQTARDLFCQLCGFMTNDDDKTIANKIKGNNFSLFAGPEASLVKLDEFLDKAIQLSQKMVAMQPPMIIDTTEKTFDNELHDRAYDLWDRKLKEGPIYYLQPTLYYGGVSIKKGEVGNITTLLD